MLLEEPVERLRVTLLERRGYHLDPFARQRFVEALGNAARFAVPARALDDAVLARLPPVPLQQHARDPHVLEVTDRATEPERFPVVAQLVVGQSAAFSFFSDFSPLPLPLSLPPVSLPPLSFDGLRLRP